MATIAEILADIDALLPTNNVGGITASILRNVLKEIVNNEQVSASQILTTSGVADATSYLAGDSTWKTYAAGGGGTTITSSANFSDTTVTAAATTYPPTSSGGPAWLVTRGRTTIGDTPTWNIFSRQSGAPASPFPASGYFQSADGSYWVLQPQNFEYWVEQFGAQPRATNDVSFDNWQAFEDCKYAILLQQTLSGVTTGGYTMRIGRGSYYLSKSHSVEGGPYYIRGEGDQTIIRVPYDQHGIIFQHYFGGFGPTIGAEGGPYNGFARPIGALVHNLGRVYKLTTVGTPASIAPTGTTTSIDGGQVWTYVRDLTWSESTGAGAIFSKISNVLVWGLWDAANSGQRAVVYDQTRVDGAFYSGVVCRTRVYIDELQCAGFPGFGLATVANGDLDLRSGGNCNNFSTRRYRGYYNGIAGYRIGYSDANAGQYQDIDTGFNGQAGIQDFNFLGNRGVNIHDQFSGAYDGVRAIWYNFVTHNGYYWIARQEIRGTDPTAPNYNNAPGTDPVSWIKYDGNGSSVAFGSRPTWVSGGPYKPCAAWASNNANSENQIIGLYVEGGGPMPQPGPRDIIVGLATGSGEEHTRGALIITNNTLTKRLPINVGYASATGRKGFSAGFGPREIDAGAANADNRIYDLQDWEGNQYELAGVGTGDGTSALNWVFREKSSGFHTWGWTGQTGTTTYGNTTAPVRTFWANKILLGAADNSITSGSAVLVRSVTSAPPTGAGTATGERNGNLLINANAGAGDPWGWQAQNSAWVALMP